MGAPTTTDRELGDQQLDAARGWLSGPEGRAAARRLIQHRRVAGVSAEDLTADALSALWLHLDRRGPLDPGVNIAAYCQTVMRNLLNDAWRARRGRDADTDDTDKDRVQTDGTGKDLQLDERILESFADPAPESGHSSSGVVNACRIAIDTDHGSSRARAGAHVVVTALGWPDALPESVPIPPRHPGATAVDVALWVALWFTDQRDLLRSSGDRATTAERQRRSRAAREMRAVLTRAISHIEVPRRYRAEEVQS